MPNVYIPSNLDLAMGKTVLRKLARRTKALESAWYENALGSSEANRCKTDRRAGGLFMPDLIAENLALGWW